MMWLSLLIVSAAALVALIYVARYAAKKINSKLRKAGVQLSCGRISSSSVSSIAVVLDKGPLQCLTVDSICWGRAARSREAGSSDGNSVSSVQQALQSSWLPIRIKGIHVVLRAAGKSGSKDKKTGKQHKARSAACSAAAWPAVSSALAVAKRLLPGIPIQLHDAAVDMKAQGLRLQLGKAALHWAVNEEQSNLSSTILMQDFSLAPGQPAEASAREPATSAPASLHCPVAQLTFDVGASRASRLPVSCSQLTLQVGLVKVTGTSQLLLQAAAAMQPLCKQTAVQQSSQSVAVPPSRMATQPPPQTQNAAAGKDTVPKFKKVANVPANVIEAVGLLPDKIKVGFAGAKLLPAASTAGMQPLLGLPLLTGSIGAFTIAASSCRRPAAMRPGEKLLNLSVGLGPVQVVAAGLGSIKQADSSTPPAAALAVAGLKVTADLVKAVDGSSSGAASKHGPLRTALLNHQQKQQRQQFKASCTCTILEQVQVQVHAHRMPDLVKSLQLLQLSVKELYRRREAAAAAVAAAQAAAMAPSQEDQEQQLPRVGSISPALSLAGSRPDTPAMGASTPQPLTPQRPGVAALQASVSTAASVDTAINMTATGMGSTPNSAGGGSAPASPLAAAMQQRFPSFRQRGSAADVVTSLLLEATAAIESGVSVEVSDNSDAVIMWLSVKQLNGSTSLDWTGSSTASDKQQAAGSATVANTVSLGAFVGLQQLAVRVAGEQSHAVAAGRVGSSQSAQQSMHQLLLLDAVELRANSVELSSHDNSMLASACAAAHGPLAVEVTAAGGQLQIAPNDACITSLLQLAEQAYVPPLQKIGDGTAMQQAYTAMLSSSSSAMKAKTKCSKAKRVAITAADISLQGATFTYSSGLPVVATYAKPAAAQAAAKGVHSQLKAAIAVAQLSLQPVHKQLAVSLQRLQVGYETVGPAGPDLPPLQSVELLQMQGVECRRYVRPNLQLLKAAVQQWRSDVHIDAVIAAAGMAEAALQQVATCAQQVQQRHAAATGALAEQQAAVAAAVAAASGSSTSRNLPAPLAASPFATVDSQQSFSTIAARLLPPACQPSTAEPSMPAGAAAGSMQLDHAGLPPVPRSSFGGSTPLQQERQHTKPVLALEARLQDVAIQLSVCEKDALLVQLELAKYSSVLEQAVLEKLRFSINDRSVVQVPHLALHNVPGWLSPGAAAAAAACISQRSSSPVRGSSVDAAVAAAAAVAPAAGGQPGHKSRSGSNEGSRSGKTAYMTAQQQFDCGASTESIRFFDDGGVQSWQSIDDPIPSASLGSRRPAETKDPALYIRQAARQQAARERCKVPESATASSNSSSGNGSDCSATTPSGISYARSAPDSSAAGGMLCFEVYAERVLFSIPHDEAPGRIILVCETWAKAVKQVLMAEIKGIKASMATIKAASTFVNLRSGSRSSSVAAAKTSTGKKGKPAYLELTVHAQQVVFCLEQNPLETWMGLHGPVLQAVAAERHLTEQLLASCSTAHGKISRTAGSGAAAGVVSAAATTAAVRQTAAAGAAKKQSRWRSLSRKGPAMTAAIAAGSITDAAAVAVCGPVAAAMAALTPGATSLQAGVVTCQANLASSVAAGPAVAAVTSNSAEIEGQSEAPLTPMMLDGSAGAADAPAAEAVLPGTPMVKATAETAAGMADSNHQSVEELDASSAAAAGPDVDVASDSSDDLDSSDNEDEVSFTDPSGLVAGLPNTAAVFAGSAAPPPGIAADAASADHLQPQGQLLVDTGGQAGAAVEGLNEMQQAVLQAHRELFSMYKFRCRPLHAAAEDPYHHSRAVMHVALARAEAVVLICLPGNVGSAAMASEVIERVDPSSQGVAMERFQSISLDVGLQDLVAHFGGVEEMASTIGSLGASGLLIRARQLCAPPQTNPMRMAVGLWHEADVPVVVKGTSPPMKMYTDIKAELDDVQGGFCPGLEAPFGQLNLAFKRLTVPNFLNPDGSVPPSRHPGLPWWDMMRYMWRGVASVRLRGLTAILANSQNPHVGLHDEKLALTAATLNAAVAAGKIDLTTTNLSAFAHTAAPNAGPGDSLLVLPAFHLPLTTVSFTITSKLPGGRSPLFHHAFPILSAAPSPDTKPQDIVDVFSLMKAEGWCLGIDIAVNSDKTTSAMSSAAAPGFGRTGAPSAAAAAAAAALGGAAGSTAPCGVAAACWHYFQPYSLPHAFIGEFQIKYIIDMVDTLVNPAIVVRLSRKLKPFYARDRRPEAAAAAKAVAAVRAQIVPMPMLKQQVDISLTADVFRVHHDAQDSEDPSDMVYIALSSMRYMNAFTYSRFRRTMQLSNGSRLKDSMRQFMTSLSVEAYDMKIIKPQGDELSAMLGGGFAGPPGSVRKAAGHSDQLNRVRQGNGPGSAGPGSPSKGSPLKGGSRLGAPAAAVDDDCAGLPGFSQGLIAAAACFLLRQAPADGAAAAAEQAVRSGTIPIDPPPVPKRPIRMIAQDVKLLCPAELRDTCILMFHHMAKAFGGITFGQPRGPVRVSTQKQQHQQQLAADSPRSGITRTCFEGSDSLSRGSTGMGTQLQRRGSTDFGLSETSLGDAVHGSSAVAAGQTAATGSSSNSMVSTPLEEELMLQRILQENKAAAAGAMRKQSSRRRDDMPACSTGSHDACTAAPGAFDAGGDDGQHAEGAGHAAVAARAVKGTVGAKASVTVLAGCDDESGNGAMLSEDSSLPSSGDGAVASPKQQQSAGGFDDTLLEYEIEFVQVQVNLVSDHARGSLVLGTNSALLMGHLHPARMERSISFKMDQVQAHVVCSEINPQQGPLWLEIANGKLSTPAGAEAIMRQVLLPFKCQLVTTKQAANSTTAAALNNRAGAASSGSVNSAQLQLQPLQQGRTGRRSSSSGLPPAGFAPSAAQELRLHVPNIVARLDSRQFEVLMDVIQNIAMAPLPTFPPSVRGMCQHPDGTSEDDDDQGVQFALESLQSLRERQRGLEKELSTVMQAHQQYMQLQQHYLQLAAQQQGRGAAQLALHSWDAAAAGSYSDSEYSSHTASSIQQGVGLSGLGGSMGYAELKEASIALVVALAAAAAAKAERSQQHRPGLPQPPASSSSSSLAAAAAAGRTASGASMVSVSRGQSSGTQGTPPDSLLLITEARTLIWWAQEQLQGAVDSITATRSVLAILRQEAGTFKVRQRNSMGVSIIVDTIDWALGKGNAIIVQGELQGISYQSIRGEDHTGTTKIQLRTATFRDPKQQRQAAAAAAAADSTPGKLGRSSMTNLGNIADSAAGDSSSHRSGGTGSSFSSAGPVQCSTPKALPATASGGGSSAAAEDAGIILAPWNPDESWEADELVRIYAIHGALEKRHVVYDHIEVMVHPIRVHLTAALAAALQDYFNLKDEDSKLVTGAAAKGASKGAAAKEDKRRVTAPGDLTPAAQAGQPASTGISAAAAAAAAAVGPITAAAARKPSIFHRRVAAAAAAAAAAASASSSTPAALPLSSPTSNAALGTAQPQIVVPPLELESGIQPVDTQAAGYVTPVDSPAADISSTGTPAAVLAAAGAEAIGSTAADGIDAASSYYTSSTAADAAVGVQQVVRTPVPPSPGPCVQPVSADAALQMRYGTVMRSKAARAAGVTTPSTTDPPAGAVVGPGGFAAAIGSSSAPGNGPGPAAAGQARVIESSSTGTGASGTLTPAVGTGAATGAMPLTPGSSAAVGTSAAAVGLQVPVRSIKFKHVRFNRMHARLTWEGPPVNITGFGLVLDNRVYRNIDGGWKIVLNRYKWDAIRSLVKSMTGLQARKLKDLEIPAFGSDPADTLELRTSSAWSNIKSIFKGRKGGGKLRLEGGLPSTDESEAGLRQGSTAGWEGGEAGEGSNGGADGVLGGGTECIDLMLDAARLKQKQKKVALLLGNVPPLPVAGVVW